MIASVIQAILAIREILQAALQLKKFVEENKTEAWFHASNQVFRTIADAKTPEQRKTAVTDLAKLWGSIQ